MSATSTATVSDPLGESDRRLLIPPYLPGSVHERVVIEGRAATAGCGRSGVFRRDWRVIAGPDRTRTGRDQHFGVEPDMIVIANGMRSGYVRLGAVLVSETLSLEHSLPVAFIRTTVTGPFALSRCATWSHRAGGAARSRTGRRSPPAHGAVEPRVA